MAQHRTNGFLAECQTEDSAAVAWFGMASSRRQAFAVCASEMNGCKIIRFLDEAEMSEDDLHQFKEWKRRA